MTTLPHIAPPCRTCGRTDRPPVVCPSWAQQGLLDGGVVAWAPTDTGGRPWEQAPAPGTVARARVRYPFAAHLGETVPVLFEPGYAHQEGWEGLEAGLSRIAILSVQPTIDHGVPEHGRHSVSLRIQAVLPVTAFVETFPALPVPSLEDVVVYGPRSFSRIQRLSHDDWEYLSWNAQGDVGGWLLFQGEHLLLAGEWGPDLATAYAGVGVVAAAERAALRARSQTPAQ